WRGHGLNRQSVTPPRGVLQSAARPTPRTVPGFSAFYDIGESAGTLRLAAWVVRKWLARSPAPAPKQCARLARQSAACPRTRLDRRRPVLWGGSHAPAHPRNPSLVRRAPDNAEGPGVRPPRTAARALPVRSGSGGPRGKRPNAPQKNARAQ